MTKWQIGQALMFQCFWFTSVLGQNRALPVALLLIGLHFFFSPTKSADVKIMPIAFIGIGIDLAFTYAGVFEFASWPIWLFVLWFGFSLTLNHSIAKIGQFPTPAVALFGGCFGTISYLAGWRFNAVEFPFGLFTTALILATSWALLLPSLFHLDKTLRRRINASATH